MATADLPIIDMSQARGPGRRQLAARVVAGLENEGFLYIDNVPGFDSQILYK